MRRSTEGSGVTAINEPVPDGSADLAAARRPSDLVAVRVFLVALSALLAGYMFLGRGFAHIGRSPVYVGEAVLLIGLVATGIAFAQRKVRLARSRIVLLLIAFMLLGVVRTVPYLGVYGVDALRDAVLWGYAVFALIILVIADRALLLGAMRLYGWVVPIFAVWLPISWNIFAIEFRGVDPSNLGSFTPLVYFKPGDMAVHIAGSIAFLVLGTGALTTARTFIWRALIAVPLLWAAFVAGTTSRGALLAIVTSLGVLALMARRSRNRIPVLTGAVVLAVILVAPAILTGGVAPGPNPVAVASASVPPGANPSPGPSANPSAPPESSPIPSPRRQVSIGQLLDNISSVFTTSSNNGLEGTKAFRLAWWKKIIDYTIFGPYFWTGKGFGVNLADDDGFQATADHSLRAPHNSHLTALARMGVPGFALWLLIQGSFGVGLLRSVLAHRRAGDVKFAAVGGWVLVYWAAAMITTSFDPYIEGPQGGIWFWVLFGLGLVVIRLTPRLRES
jgi:hypothetical protein